MMRDLDRRLDSVLPTISGESCLTTKDTSVGVALSVPLLFMGPGVEVLDVSAKHVPTLEYLYSTLHLDV